MHHENLGVNTMCSWATPNPNPKFTAAGARRESPSPSSIAARMRPAIKRSATPINFVVTTPMPHTYVSAVPQSWDVRNVAGGSFSTVDLNQHNPNYCGRYDVAPPSSQPQPPNTLCTSCWTHATVSALGDRIKMSKNAAFPDINLSPPGAPPPPPPSRPRPR